MSRKKGKRMNEEGNVDERVVRKYINMAVDKHAQERMKNVLENDPYLFPLAEMIEVEDPFSFRTNLFGLLINDESDEIRELAREVDSLFFDEVKEQWTNANKFVKNLEEARVLCEIDLGKEKCEKMFDEFSNRVDDFRTFGYNTRRFRNGDSRGKK